MNWILISKIVGYLISGLIWTIYLWYGFKNKEIKFYEEERLRFLISNGIRKDEIPDYLSHEWKILVNSVPRLRSVPPVIEDHFIRLGFNFLFWWLSILFYLLNILNLSLQLVAENPVDTKIEKIKNELK